MYWTLFVFALLENGRIDYDIPFETIETYETWEQCQVNKSLLIALMPPPDNLELMCLRTDMT